MTSATQGAPTTDSRETGRRFKGRRALVTGGASGIGLATARLLAAEGADLVVVDRDEDGLEPVREELASHEVVVCDQTDDSDLELLAEKITADPVDVCFANAGYGGYGEFVDASIASLRKHLEVNVVGTAAVMRLAARSMIAAGHGGSIVVTASTAAERPTALFSHYAASKAAALMLVRSTAIELGCHGIRVNAVLPGVTTTRMTGGILGDERSYRWAVRETPLARVATPEDIATVVAFLASGDARHITGEGLLVDGGQTLHGFPRWFAKDPHHADAPWQLYPDYVAGVT